MNSSINMVGSQLTLKEYVLDDFPLLKKQWEHLQNGHDMTYFQRYTWYSDTIIKFRIEDSDKFISRIFIVYDGSIPVLIAPLRLLFHTFNFINKAGAYFLDDNSYADYGNFIYDSFNTSALKLIISYIIRVYKIQQFFFTRLAENVDSYKYVCSLNSVCTIKRNITVALELPQDIESYQKLLSKNSRQNIRTAFNRLKKDNIKVDMFFDDSNADYDCCVKLKKQRLNFIVQRNKRYANFFNKLFDAFRNRFELKRPSYMPFEQDQKGKIMTLKINDLTIAFFYYGFDDIQNKVVVMCAGIDDNYKYYSPGICLMYSFVLEMISQNNKIHFIDFTRGTEFYKYALGGQNNYIYDISLDYNKTASHLLKINIVAFFKRLVKKYLFK